MPSCSVLLTVSSKYALTLSPRSFESSAEGSTALGSSSVGTDGVGASSAAMRAM